MSLSIYSETERLVSLYQSYYYQYLEYHFRTSRGVKTTLLGDVEITLQEMSNIHRRKGWGRISITIISITNISIITL